MWWDGGGFRRLRWGRGFVKVKGMREWRKACRLVGWLQMAGVVLGICAAGAWGAEAGEGGGGAVAEVSGEAVEDDGAVLGEVDLAERAEILRNLYRRMTPPEVGTLEQDVGTWPAAWEEFGAGWEGAGAVREYGAWVVPFTVEQEGGATVVRDGSGGEMWRGVTDFAREESAGVALTGGLVAEEDWGRYAGVREAVEGLRRLADGTSASPVRTGATNGLRFTACEWTTNGTFRLDLAYEAETNVEVFAYAVAHTSAWVVATWTNDENLAVTDTNLVWYPAGPVFNGRDSDWELRGTVSIENGIAGFEDSRFPENLGRVRFYAAAVAKDTDADGLSDGMECFQFHSNSLVTDTDEDGLGDGTEVLAGTDPLNPDIDFPNLVGSLNLLWCGNGAWYP